MTGALGTVMVEAPPNEITLVPSRMSAKYKSETVGMDTVLELWIVSCRSVVAPPKAKAPSGAVDVVNEQPAMDIVKAVAVVLTSRKPPAAARDADDAVIAKVVAAPIVKILLAVAVTDAPDRIARDEV
jgi:hypothetical protein